MNLIAKLFLIAAIGVPPVWAQRMYDSTGRQIGRVDAERSYDASGRQIGRVDWTRIHDASGRQLGRIDGERIYDASGRQRLNGLAYTGWEINATGNEPTGPGKGVGNDPIKLGRPASPNPGARGQ